MPKTSISGDNACRLSLVTFHKHGKWSIISTIYSLFLWVMYCPSLKILFLSFTPNSKLIRAQIIPYTKVYFIKCTSNDEKILFYLSLKLLEFFNHAYFPLQRCLLLQCRLFLLFLLLSFILHHLLPIEFFKNFLSITTIFVFLLFSG